MKPKDTKRAIEQLITDIIENDWFCQQASGESNMEEWEKELIVIGLRKLLEEVSSIV